MTTLESLEAELAGLPSDEALQRQLNDLRQKHETVSVRIQVARSATAAVASAEHELAAATEWFNHLTAWRQTLCDELLALPPRIRSGHQLGVQQNLKLSILAIDRGQLATDSGYQLENLKLGDLMRASGFAEAPKIENQIVGPLPWFGSLPETERRIKVAQAARADAEQRLHDALMTDDDRAGEAAEVARRNALPQRKTRGDGSQYDKYPDGREVEVPA
jgi:hypothetical protein